MIDPVIIADKKKRPDPVREECKQHLLFCRTKCEDFEGKKDTLEVRNYNINALADLRQNTL